MNNIFLPFMLTLVSTPLLFGQINNKSLTSYESRADLQTFFSQPAEKANQLENNNISHNTTNVRYENKIKIINKNTNNSLNSVLLSEELLNWRGKSAEFDTQLSANSVPGLPQDSSNAKTTIKDFGAVGDGISDDTNAIQLAINNLPLNSSDKGILTPRGFANGGLIFVPRGRYKVTKAILLRRGIRLCGESRESSQIISYTTGSVLKYEDGGRYIQDEIVIENLSIWQDSRVVSSSGAGIECFFGPTTPESLGVIVRNVYIEGTFRGVLLGAGVWCSFDNVNASKCKSYGFDIRFSASGIGVSTSTTSTTFKNCYASLCDSGFRIERGAYCSFVSCASDSNVNYGYIIEYGLGHSLIACGAEENGIAGIYINNATGILINAYITYGIAKGPKHGIILKMANSTTILSGAMNAVTASGGYGLDITVQGGPLTVIGTDFLGNFKGHEINNTQKVIMLSGDGTLLGGGELRFLTPAGPVLKVGIGSPEGVIKAPVGSIYLRTDGGPGTSLYIKEYGTSNTGWVGK